MLEKESPISCVKHLVASQKQTADLKGPSLLRKLEKTKMKKKTINSNLPFDLKNGQFRVALGTVFPGRVDQSPGGVPPLHEEPFQYQTPLWGNTAIHEASAK